MKITPFGQQQITSKAFRVGLLKVAFDLSIRNMARADLETSLCLMVAQYLCGTNEALPMASTEEITEDFLSENAALISPIVRETVEGALATRAAMIL